LTSLKKNILGNDELLELELPIYPKICKGSNAEDENAVFTMVPQLPSKYLPTTFIPIYLIFLLMNVYIFFTNKFFIVY